MTVSKPTIKSVGNVYTFEWKPEDITVKVDRLADKSDGVTGEALVMKGAGHLYHARINLLSAHSKQIMANELKKRVNGLDWQTVIEQAFLLTLREYRKGEPAIKLGNLPKRDRPRYRLYPFLLEEEMTVLYGYGGNGKSKFAQLLALTIQTGQPILGMRPLQGNVLICDWETSAYTVNEWITALKVGIGIESDAMPMYRFCYRGLADDIVEIQRIVLEHDIKLIIIDSVGIAIGGDAESQDMTRQYFSALRSLKISSLSIDHKPKKGNSIYGSVYKTNIPRATFEIRGQQPPGSNYMDIGIYHRKANDVPLIKPVGYHIEFEGDEESTNSATYTKQDIIDIPELVDGLSKRQQLVEILKHGALEVREIAEGINSTDAVVRTLLNRNKQTFVKAEGNKWGLLTNYEV